MHLHPDPRDETVILGHRTEDNVCTETMSAKSMKLLRMGFFLYQVQAQGYGHAFNQESSSPEGKTLTAFTDKDCLKLLGGCFPMEHIKPPLSPGASGTV